MANVIIPASFASALRDGLSVPVYLRYQDDAHGTEVLTEEPIGNATLRLKESQLQLLNIDFTAGKNQGLLKDSLIQQLSADSERPFANDGRLQVDANASMQLDLVAMHLTIDVSREAFSKAKAQAKEISLSPSVDDLTSVHSYNLGYSFANNDAGYFDSNFLQLASTLGYGAHHLMLDGSFYNLGEAQQSGQLYRSMYERDLENRRIAAGMVSTWDLQSLGMVSALNTGRIYGASYGNQAQSRKNNVDESTTPVQVFMPAKGEVRVYRDGRMIALQNLSIGNQSIDTATFPSGVYNITVEVYVDGRLTETTTQRVTKLGGGNQFVNSWGWQWWGGWMESSVEGQQDSPLLGVSVSRTVDALTFSGTSYAFSEAVVGESAMQWQASERVSLGLQTMLSSEGSWRLGSNASLQLIDNVTLWVSQEKLSSGDRLSLSNSDQVSLGTSLNLGGWIDGLGQLSFSTTHDRQFGSDRSYLDYYQNLYSGRYGSLSLRASLQSNSGTLSGFDNKSATLDYSVPLGNLFSLGMSSNEQGQSSANLSYQKQMEGAINQVTFNASRLLSGMGDSKRAHDPSISGSLGFDNQAISGTMTLGRSNMGDWNGNLMGRGAIATTGDHLAITSQGTTSSGLLIDTGISKDGQMLAKINGRDYPLQGERTFIGLSPYGEYEIELLNSKKSRDSYEINGGKQRYTLFPGNVATLDASRMIREMVTVFGIIRAEDGSLLSHARLDNHIGTTMTNEQGEFSLDVEKNNPTLTFTSGNESCSAEIDIRDSKGAEWVGEITCHGLATYAYQQN